MLLLNEYNYTIRKPTNKLASPNFVLLAIIRKPIVKTIGYHIGHCYAICIAFFSGIWR